MARTGKASRLIRAPAQKIYAAHVDPQAVALASTLANLAAYAE